MTTLYIRDVPEDVADVLKERAMDHGKSLSAYVADLLTKAAQAPTHEEVVKRIFHRDRSDALPTEELVDAVRRSRR